MSGAELPDTSVLERWVQRPRFQLADRLLLSALSWFLPRSAWRSFLVNPETLLRWHRELVGRNWAFLARRPRRGRPGQSAERENPRWGYRRIQGEPLKLGCRSSHGTVRSVLGRHGLLPAPRRSQRTWREFVRQNAEQLLAVDFFSVETLWLQRFHVLFCILTAISPVRLRELHRASLQPRSDTQRGSHIGLAQNPELRTALDAVAKKVVALVHEHEGV